MVVTFGQSRLYKSEDYGKSFTDITQLINNTFIRTEFGIAIGPDNSGKVVLTADVSGGHHGRIFRSEDFGKSFIQTDLPFEPQQQILYHPRNASSLLVISLNKSLWLSMNFGDTWQRIHEKVCSVRWGPEDEIYFTTDSNELCIGRGALELCRSTDFGKTSKVIAQNIFSFGLGGKFLFASIMTGKGNLRMIHVSVDRGDTWNMAQLPPVGHEQFYSILAANDYVVFMHVDEPGDTGFGTIYVSDDRGLLYSKSLERHLYTATGGETDFTNVTSLRGVYITSVLSEDGSVKSVITYDRGGEWSPLRKPENSECDATAKSKDKCSLHIHAAYSISQKVNVPLPPISEPSAVGLVLAHGSVGDAMSLLNPDVYVSDDGGYSWIRALKGPHHYAILDSGGLIVAVEYHTQYHSINTIKFSTDEGQCWYSYNFTDDPIYFTGLASEPGAKSMTVSIWGYRETLISQYWASFTVDFRDLLTRNCEDGDYTKWLAHSRNTGDSTDGCMLGYKEQFLRLRKSSVCRNGRDYVITKQPAPCPCTLEDFLCDFGYYRPENKSECVEQPEISGILEFCFNGTQEQLQTTGYRKIPGDMCEGGILLPRKIIDLKKKCNNSSSLVNPPLDVPQSHQSVPTSPHSIVIFVTIIAILLVIIILGVLLVKKYVCGGRFLVHRYSVLQQNVEASGVDTEEKLESSAFSSSKPMYHDDSDEDLLE
ncbi:sortilin isoform X2 [Protopterus annectens]|nr:sortilin isoform X2 [Protopterus annectens]